MQDCVGSYLSTRWINRNTCKHYSAAVNTKWGCFKVKRCKMVEGCRWFLDGSCVFVLLPSSTSSLKALQGPQQLQALLKEFWATGWSIWNRLQPRCFSYLFFTCTVRGVTVRGHRLTGAFALWEMPSKTQTCVGVHMFSMCVSHMCSWFFFDISRAHWHSVPCARLAAISHAGTLFMRLASVTRSKRTTIVYKYVTLTCAETSTL